MGASSQIAQSIPPIGDFERKQWPSRKTHFISNVETIFPSAGSIRDKISYRRNEITEFDCFPNGAFGAKTAHKADCAASQEVIKSASFIAESIHGIRECGPDGLVAHGDQGYGDCNDGRKNE